MEIDGWSWKDKILFNISTHNEVSLIKVPFQSQIISLIFKKLNVKKVNFCFVIKKNTKQLERNRKPHNLDGIKNG